MKIELPKELQDYVLGAVQSGRVKNESEAIVEAVRLWRDMESDWTSADEDALRKSINQICDDIDRGSMSGRSAADVFSDLERENAEFLRGRRPS